MEGVVRSTLGRNDDSRERRKQPAKLGSVGRKLVRDFRGESRKDPMLAFAPATATLLLDYEDGFVVVE